MHPFRLTRRQCLAGGAAALGTSITGTSARGATTTPTAPRNLIVVVAAGGWDTTYVFEPRPGSLFDAAKGNVRSFANIPTLVHPDRPAVTRFFEAYGDLVAVVNGVHTQSISHADCTARMLTGTASDGNPDLGAITARQLGAHLPAPYLVLGHTSYSGPYAALSARVGSVNQITTLLDPSGGYSTEPARTFVPDETERELIRDAVEGRARGLGAWGGDHAFNRAKMEDFVGSIGRGDRLVGLSDFGDFGYGRDLRAQCALAVEAISQEVSWSVQIEQRGWDTHFDNSPQGSQFETMFDALSFLTEELLSRPGRRAGSSMFDETVVAVLSEMGRTPFFNLAQGKDHWPVTSSLLLGGGIDGGRVLGCTNEGLETQPIDFSTGSADPEGRILRCTNLVAGIVDTCGGDPSIHWPEMEPFVAFRG